MDTKCNYLYLGIWQTFSGMWTKEACRSKANWQYLLIIKLWAVKVENCGKPTPATVFSTTPKDWSRKRGGDMNNSDFLILYNKMSQHLEDLTWWTNIFQLTNAWSHKLVWGWKPVNASCLHGFWPDSKGEVQQGLVRFHTVAELYDIVTCSSFGVTSQKTSHNFLKRLSKYSYFSSSIYMRTDFFFIYFNHKKFHNRMNVEVDIKKKKSICFLLRQTFKRFAKNAKTLITDFFFFYRRIS